MVLYHQTFSPSTCDCVIEEQFEYNIDTSTPEQPTLWFFHKVCDRHLPLVDNPLPQGQLNNKRQNITDHHKFLLEENRKRHIKNFDDNPNNKNIKDIAAEMKKSPDKTTRDNATKLELKLMEERNAQERFLDKHEDDSMNRLLLGIHYPNAFNASRVYDAIRQEQVQANV